MLGPAFFKVLSTFLEELVEAVASWAALPLSDMPNWPGKNEGCHCLFVGVVVATHTEFLR